MREKRAYIELFLDEWGTICSAFDADAYEAHDPEGGEDAPEPLFQGDVGGAMEWALSTGASKEEYDQACY